MNVLCPPRQIDFQLPCNRCDEGSCFGRHFLIQLSWHRFDVDGQKTARKKAVKNAAVVFEALDVQQGSIDRLWSQIGKHLMSSRYRVHGHGHGHEHVLPLLQQHWLPRSYPSYVLRKCNPRAQPSPVRRDLSYLYIRTGRRHDGNKDNGRLWKLRRLDSTYWSLELFEIRQIFWIFFFSFLLIWLIRNCDVWSVIRCNAPS